jgi:predicted ABC-type ATPase
MVVVAGPPGSGKSLFFPVGSLADAAFNVDDRAAELNGGSYRKIPRTLRVQAQRECEAFVGGQIESRTSFAVETTLRSRAAIDQASQAKTSGFETVLLFMATEDVEENVMRVARRGLLGGHSAPAAEIREIYAASLRNLERALDVFDSAELFDTTGFGAPPVHVATKLGDAMTVHVASLPAWFPARWRVRM